MKEQELPDLCAYSAKSQLLTCTDSTNWTYIDHSQRDDRLYKELTKQCQAESFDWGKSFTAAANLGAIAGNLKQVEAKREIKKVAEKVTSGKRVVQVFIVDADKHIPTEKALLYKSEQLFTDLTDQELFFEIDIKPLLEAHNNFRKTVTRQLHNSAEKVYLDPIKIRDLKMVVSTLAEF